MMLCPVNGLMMNMWAVEGEASMGMRLDQAFQLLQAVDQRVGRADVLGGGGVGIVFARARDGHLDQHGGDGRQNHHERCRPTAAAAVVVVAAAAEPEGHAGQHGDGGGERGGHRADQDVAMQHVAQLVGHHAFDFVVVHESAGCPAVKATEACDGLRPVAKALGESLGDELQLGHGQAHALAEVAHDGRHAAVDFGVLGFASPAAPSTSRARSCRRRSSWRSSSRRRRRGLCRGRCGRARAPPPSTRRALSRPRSRAVFRVLVVM